MQNLNVEKTEKYSYVVKLMNQLPHFVRDSKDTYLFFVIK